ncbi:amidoligase family protein [Salinisphaera aquimarina]|uniref:Amidoligase family protein n=1 Tax=Salinisphaera aquimarina TaxID=2094031 RepID=A0ABV7EM69_9GAMM
MTPSTTASGNAPLRQPSRRNTAANGERRVGVELEFTGLTIERIGETLRACLGGDIRPHSAYEYTVENTTLGDFAVELDYAFLKERGRREHEPGLLDELEQVSEDVLGALAKRVVPLEIVCPPIAIGELHRLHPMLQALRDAGARGTSQSALYAFGLHLNPELPDLETDTLLAYIRAFAVAFDWLKRVSEIDISRRVFPYIQPYSKVYVRTVCDPSYTPTKARLISDYLAENATRNRALDMLPVFAHMDDDRVRAAVPDDLVNARPTLHYRLPNCEIEQPGWDLNPAWNHWLVIEELAADAPRLIRICEDYCSALDKPFGDWLGRWGDGFERYL